MTITGPLLPTLGVAVVPDSHPECLSLSSLSEQAPVFRLEACSYEQTPAELGPQLWGKALSPPSPRLAARPLKGVVQTPGSSTPACRTLGGLSSGQHQKSEEPDKGRLCAPRRDCESPDRVLALPCRFLWCILAAVATPQSVIAPFSLSRRRAERGKKRSDLSVLWAYSCFLERQK